MTHQIIHTSIHFRGKKKCYNGGQTRAAVHESHSTPLWVSSSSSYFKKYTHGPKGKTTFVLDFLWVLYYWSFLEWLQTHFAKINLAVLPSTVTLAWPDSRPPTVLVSQPYICPSYTSTLLILSVPFGNSLKRESWQEMFKISPVKLSRNVSNIVEKWALLFVRVSEWQQENDRGG